MLCLFGSDEITLPAVHRCRSIFPLNSFRCSDSSLSERFQDSQSLLTDLDGLQRSQKESWCKMTEPRSPAIDVVRPFTFRVLQLPQQLESRTINMKATFGCWPGAPKPWSSDEVRVYVAQVRAELKDPKLHIYCYRWGHLPLFFGWSLLKNITAASMG